MIVERRKMRVYLAGPRAEWGRVTYWDEQLRKLPGVECTHTWVERIRELGHSQDERLTDSEQRVASTRCLEDLVSADLVWVLFPAGTGRGSMVEMGFALARGHHVVVSGVCAHMSSFTSLATSRFAEDFTAFKVLEEWSGSIEPSERVIATVGAVP